MPKFNWTKLTIKTAILCCCTILLQSIFDNLRPILGNKIALLQMHNDDFALVMLNGFNKFSNMVPIVWLAICVLLYSKEIKLIINYFKNKENNNEEN